ncbi:MAG TPA: ATP synthase F0 subunit C [Firmicutes bacterium]|nr:MAG: ATP synthase F0 subunit C [Candidatus Coatesbacteria bacterium]RLC42149.1 MAG: ATP synthase F0 subunit C [Candidatus Coatesbacteria bacterium]RLC43847.1 MAG: ATP synthase F0 subunit C [Candidatus Coatesbacteria bacterium]HDM43335.1 ATP synthase F0 subunit C [Bacillota bacterium]
MSIAVASAFAMAIAAIGAAISQARAAVSAMEAVARQPEASGKIQIQMILALVFIETLAIYTLVVVLILLFANPFTKYVVG